MPRGNEVYNTHASKDVVQPVILVRFTDIPSNADLAVKETLLLNDGTQPEVYNGQTYYNTNLLVESVRARDDGSLPECLLSIDNVGREFTSLAQGYSLNGVPCVVMRATREILDAGVSMAQVLFDGKVRAVAISENSVQFKLTGGVPYHKRVPRRVFSANNFPRLPKAKDPRTPNY